MYSNRPLTKNQSRILEFVSNFRREGGGSPTYREIAAHFGFKSPKAAVDHIEALEKKGYIRRRSHKARTIELVVAERELREDSIHVPVLGDIPAGRPEVKAEQGLGTLAVDPVLLGKATGHRLFVVEVRGDSMERAGILDEDWVVADADAAPREGEVVVALIDGENTLKTLAKREGEFFLKAENPNYPEYLPLDEMMIQGVVKVLLRRI